MIVGKLGILTCKVVVVVLLLSFDVFVAASAQPILFAHKFFPQIDLNVSLALHHPKWFPFNYVCILQYHFMNLKLLFTY